MTTSMADIHRKKYEEMFRTHFSSLCYFAQKYVADFDTCKEIVHKVFVAIWEKREEFDFEKQAKSYLYTAVYNRCMNSIRDNKSRPIDTNLEINDTTVVLMVQNDHMEAAELEAKIWELINQLPERCREIFILNRFENKKYSEIAEMLGISVKTVETQMSKALGTLREGLKNYIQVILILFIKNL